MLIWARRLFFVALVLYLIVGVAAFLAQRKLLYFPSDFYQPPPAGWAEVKSPNGILGWHLPAQDGRPTLMVFHGNASAIDSNIHIFRDLHSAGYGIWSVGYPGYPGNDGKPTQKSLVQAASEQYKMLEKTGATDIVFYGTSLGSGVASQLATQFEPRILILDAPFNSVADMAAQQMPFLPTRILLKDKWDSAHALEGLSVPLIWIHGTADQIVPIKEGQKLFDGYSGPKSSYIAQGANHINTWFNGGRETVLRALEEL